ncbi:MAG: aminomethyltransferase family protein [Caldilineales bacterium]|nr:aminomethyltransferase family protein [Caldilineales bacterium]
MPTSLAIPADYTAAHEAVVFHRIADAGYLRLGGEHRIDFLNRQTTNDMHRLGPGRAVTTVLTTPTARVEDVLVVIPEEENVGVITLPGRAQATAKTLSGKIFFMDRVTVADASAEFAQYDLFGPEAGEALARLGFELAPGLDEVVSGLAAGESIRVIGRPGLGGGPGFRVVVRAESVSVWEQALLDADVKLISAEAMQIVRVEAGLPTADAELTVDYTPLEANLDWAISQTKGCYTGQEIIARQINYEKISRRLVGLRLQAEAAPGVRVSAEGKPIGEITSTAMSPRFGAIALAILRRPHFDPGQQVIVDNAGEEIPATVVALPFA